VHPARTTARFSAPSLKNVCSPGSPSGWSP
jgi:hypothetical protein